MEGGDAEGQVLQADAEFSLAVWQSPVMEGDDQTEAEDDSYSEGGEEGLYNSCHMCGVWVCV